METRELERAANYCGMFIVTHNLSYGNVGYILDQASRYCSFRLAH
jgi:hypothetical protein